MHLARLGWLCLAAVIAVAAATALVEHDRDAAGAVSALAEIGLDRAERPPPGAGFLGLAGVAGFPHPAGSPFLGHAPGGPFSVSLLRSLRFSLIEPVARPPAGGRSTPGAAWREATLVRATGADRARIQAYARRYRIPQGLSAQIYEAAVAERVNPALAYSLVRTESGFDPEAVGMRGAIGLTQIRPSTAR
ncbi:MAG TPA: transglycosylase SLT domain-containing protein, partial [Gemmatimonadota bacterium]